jgi:hypothetical protein
MERSTYWMRRVLKAPDAAPAGHPHRPSVRLTPSSETLAVTCRIAGGPGFVTEIPAMLVPPGGSALAGSIRVTIRGSGTGAPAMTGRVDGGAGGGAAGGDGADGGTAGAAGAAGGAGAGW